ncbi:CRE-DEL-2 protein [Caenorhabditis remanei]|uniref:CRE-DEL-2 protein n=1 Tax=Caenorhabditis remanei TaxID=31234 RepID=E3MRA0_CAERE|nr:CRE-DEL-2 protein [Caenorhabditis remanei]
MTAEVIDCTRRNLEEAMNHSERRMLFRRSRSEPMTLTNENVMMTSRTDPEWNMTVDSISIQSSFAEYQQRRRQRLKKQEAHKTSEISLSSGTSELVMKGHAEFEDVPQFSDEQMPSTLSLTDSDNSSNDITSSQAQEISYEEEMRIFMEKTGHMITNVFADPFDSDERKSRTEMWVEASTENLAEGETSEDVGKGELKLELDGLEDNEGEEKEEGKEITTENDFDEEDETGEFGEETSGTSKVQEDSGENDVEVEKDNEQDEKEQEKFNVPPIVHQDTKESLLSSTVTVTTLMKSSMDNRLKEATYAESEVDVKDIDRFWDYLYDKDLKDKDQVYSINIEAPSTTISDRSLHLGLPPIKVDFTGVHIDQDFKWEGAEGIEMNAEQDRELGEPLEITDHTVESRFFELETTKKLERIDGSHPIMMRTTASQTPVSQELVKIVNYESTRFRSQSQDGRMSYEKENMVREFSFKLSENLYKDLKVLVVERDRAKHAMTILPAKSMKELSDECNYYQTRYRVRIEQNKEKLDRRIDEIWKKLLKMPIESQDVIDFISVSESELLTCNARRNLPEMI